MRRHGYISRHVESNKTAWMETHTDNTSPPTPPHLCSVHRAAAQVGGDALRGRRRGRSPLWGHVRRQGVGKRSACRRIHADSRSFAESRRRRGAHRPVLPQEKRGFVPLKSFFWGFRENQKSVFGARRTDSAFFFLLLKMLKKPRRFCFLAFVGTSERFSCQ